MTWSSPGTDARSARTGSPSTTIWLTACRCTLRPRVDVFAAGDGEPEVAIGAPRWGLAGLGNHVGIEVAPGEFLFVGHLQPGTVTVAVGDRVAAGQLLGRVGNSGNSSEPHVHLHLQDTPRSWFGEGIPFHFHGYRHAGRLVERGMPEGGRREGEYRGQRVAHADPGAAGGGR